MRDISTLAQQGIQHAVPTAQAEQPLQVNPVVRKLFMLLHGAYGNLFAAKFATGEKDSQGRDKGIRAAMKVWESALAKFPADVIETATGRLTAEHLDFPPNLPQFEAICRALTPRNTHAELHGYAMLPAPKLERMNVSIEPLGDGRDWARKIKARHEAGDKTVTPGVYRSALQALGGGQ